MRENGLKSCQIRLSRLVKPILNTTQYIMPNRREERHEDKCGITGKLFRGYRKSCAPLYYYIIVCIFCGANFSPGSYLPMGDL